MTMTLLPIITFVLLGVGMVLVIYGTIAKNRWGINLDPVSCPRCNTQLPQIRQPQSLRHRLWGGGACPSCGVEVDKWGREIASHGPRPSIATMSQEQLLKTAKKKFLISSAAIYFCLSLVFHWLGAGPANRHLPLTPTGWLILVASAAVETGIFTALFYFVSFHLFRWLLHSRKQAKLL